MKQRGARTRSHGGAAVAAVTTVTVAVAVAVAVARHVMIQPATWCIDRLFFGTG